MNENRMTSALGSSECAACGVRRNQGERCDYCGVLYLDTIEMVSSAHRVGTLHSKYLLKQNGDDVEITWKWKNPIILILLPGSLIFTFVGFSLFDLGKFLSNPLSVFPIPAFHIIIGILFSIYIFPYLVNSTRIVANTSLLTIRHYPIPARRNKKFDAVDIKQIYVSKNIYTRKGRRRAVPVLELVLVNGSRHELVKGYTDNDFTDYQTLRQHLLKALNKTIPPTQV